MTFTTKKWFLKSMSRQVNLPLVLLLSTVLLMSAFYFYNTQKNELNLANQTLIKWPDVIILLTAGFVFWISNNKNYMNFTESYSANLTENRNWLKSQTHSG